MKSIAVFCGSSAGTSSKIIKMARDLGVLLANEQIELVYGGSKIGLMGELASSALKEGGSVIGIIPEFLKTKEVVHSGISELLVTENMHDRKVAMYERSEGFLIIPGGFGTMDEFFEITTWGQLGLHSKPIAILNMDGYYDHLIKQFERMVQTGLLNKVHLNTLIVAQTVEEVLVKMKAHQPKTGINLLNIDRI